MSDTLIVLIMKSLVVYTLHRIVRDLFRIVSQQHAIIINSNIIGGNLRLQLQLCSALHTSKRCLHSCTTHHQSNVFLHYLTSYFQAVLTEKLIVVSTVVGTRSESATKDTTCCSRSLRLSPLSCVETN